MKPGLPVVISAPSGGGKSTIASRLLAQEKALVRSISCTTRSPRTGETNGVDYFFVSEKEFKSKIEGGHFLEWAKVHSNYYGTPRQTFDAELNAGHDVLLTIDPQGAVSLRKLYPAGIYVFVVPPSWDILEKRLFSRASDDDGALKVRLAGARTELKSLPHYDYIVVNDDLENAVTTVGAIIRAEHHRLTHVDKKDIAFLQSLDNQ